MAVDNNTRVADIEETPQIKDACPSCGSQDTRCAKSIFFDRWKKRTDTFRLKEAHVWCRLGLIDSCQSASWAFASPLSLKQLTEVAAVD